MTIKEVVDKVNKTVKRISFPYEKAVIKAGKTSTFSGAFEAVLTGRGDEKYLIPEYIRVCTLLYRGQNAEYDPCVPTLFRNEPSETQIFLERMRLTVFKRMLRTYPIVEHFFRRHHFVVDTEGLAQHYGLKTSMLDLTSNLDVALFFATCKYDPITDTYNYYDDQDEHEAILYVYDFMSYDLLEDHLYSNIRPIGLQVFPRPGAQEGYSLHLPKGYGPHSWMYKFNFTSEDSKHYYNVFKKGEALWSHDFIVPITKDIARQTEFSYSVFDETYACYRPKGYSKTRLKSELKNDIPDITLSARVPDVAFSSEERREIIEEWNDHLGREFCSKIVRKPWRPKVKDTVTGEDRAGAWKDFRNIHMITNEFALALVANPERPEGAEWRSYGQMQKMRTKHNGRWMKEDGKYVCLYGKPWLTEKDWLINP